MSAEQAAYAALSADAAVTALVSTRIYPDFVPQEKTLPSVSISRVGTEYITTIHTDTPLGAKVTLEVWCMADARKSAEELADAVIPALAGARFGLLDRIPEFDAENGVFASVLTALFLE
jgi:hypothetical protein